MTRLAVGLEVGRKRAFAWALDLPGWCRSGKTRETALDALIAAAPRYAPVAALAGVPMPDLAAVEVEVEDETEGDSGTEFGVPYVIAPSDRRAVTAAEAVRLAASVEAAWNTFDRVAADAPSELRKGPRGGGRDRDKMIEHVLGADHAYAREMGVRLPAGSLSDRAAVETERAAVLDVLRQPSDGSPLAGRKWPQRYAARRIAWHALDHAWEMEDRAEPG